MRHRAVYAVALLGGLWTLAAMSRPGNFFSSLQAVAVGGFVVAAIASVVMIERLSSARRAAGCAVGGVVVLGAALVFAIPVVVLLVGIVVALATIVLASQATADGVLRTRQIAIAVAVFVGPLFAAPFGERTALWLLHDDYVDFAEQVRAGELPASEVFRIGPYRYDGVCVSTSERVIVWNDGEGLQSHPAIVVNRAGEIGHTMLVEDSPEFACNEARILALRSVD